MPESQLLHVVHSEARAISVEAREHPATEVFENLRSNLSRNLSISAVKTALFLLLRVFAISRWDWQVAGDVASTVDFGTAPIIMLGTLFAEPVLTGTAVMVLLPLVSFDIIFPSRGPSPGSMTRFLTIFALVAVGLSLVTSMGIWWLPFGAIAMVGVMSVLRLGWEQSRAHTVLTALLQRVGLIVGITALVLATLVSTPWTSLEEIETTSGTVTGYVLDNPSGFLKVLTEDERELSVLIASDVISRHAVVD